MNNTRDNRETLLNPNMREKTDIDERVVKPGCY